MSRVLLLMAHKENRRLLAGWLATRHEVVLPDSAAPQNEPFDLGIVDGPALEAYGSWVRAAKEAEQPIFLPFLLVTPRQGIGLATRHLWETVDELIIGPVEKAELRARVETLLRVRQLSLANAALARRLEAELARAAEVQAELLPRTVPTLPGFELSARCRPAREVGGDFFDWQQPEPGILTLTVGDVMGKGMPAALLMATARATLRAVSRQNGPAAALDLARQALQTDLEQTWSFVTLFHARLELGPRRLTYADAGHGHAFMRRADGSAEVLQRGGRPLGFPSRQAFPEATVVFQPGDALVVYSDGLPDARPELELTPATLAAMLAPAGSAAAMADQLLALAGQDAPPPDDLTVLALRCG